MKISPQITQIDTDYKKTKKICAICVICVICGSLFFIRLRARCLTSLLYIPSWTFSNLHSHFP
jgi:hypothetical protein